VGGGGKKRREDLTRYGTRDFPQLPVSLAAPIKNFRKGKRVEMLAPMAQSDL